MRDILVAITIAFGKKSCDHDCDGTVYYYEIGDALRFVAYPYEGTYFKCFGTYTTYPYARGCLSKPATALLSIVYDVRTFTKRAKVFVNFFSKFLRADGVKLLVKSPKMVLGTAMRIAKFSRVEVY